jgi:hypothetical protein
MMPSIPARMVRLLVKLAFMHRPLTPSVIDLRSADKRSFVCRRHAP